MVAPPFVVYVGGIAENVSTYHVRCHFEDVGEAKDVTTVEMHSRRDCNGKVMIYAFVEFTKKDLAKNAVEKFNGKPLHQPQGGGKIRVADISEVTDDDPELLERTSTGGDTPAPGSSSSSSDHAEDRPTLYVGAIPAKDASKENIEELFAGIDVRAKMDIEVELLPISNGEGMAYAFVELRNIGASVAVNALNGKEIGGKKIRVADVSQIKNAKEHETIPFNIGDKEEYIKFITDLREMVSISNINGHVEDLFDDDKRRGAHRLLAEPPIHGNPPAQWIHIQITAKKGNTVTLAVRRDNLYVKGFMNKHDCWYELPGSAVKLPAEYNATELEDWDVEYGGMMNLNDIDQVKRTLTSTRLGMAFAERAVCRLSEYYRAPPVNNDDVQVKNDENPTRLGLAGLVVMICEAARMNPFLDTIAGGWNVGTGLTTRLSGIMWQWASMSAALLKWKKSHYKEWPLHSRDTLGDALASIYLVGNSKAIKGRERASVEIISVNPVSSDDDNIVITDITVINEEHATHNIYRKQGEGSPQNVDLIVKNARNISGYKQFSIKVDTTATSGRGRRITRTWHCLNQEADRAEATELVQRAVFLESGKIDFTYLVMSNAAKVSVAVQLIERDSVSTSTGTSTSTPQGDGHTQPPPNRRTNYNAVGEISARIVGLDPPHNKIVLYRSTNEKACLTLGKSILTRSVFPVPYGMQRLDIVLPTIREGGKVVKESATLEFPSSEPTKTVSEQLAGLIEFEVKVDWSGLPQQKEQKKEKTIDPDVKIKVEDKFTDSIKKLRNGLTKSNDDDDGEDRSESNDDDDGEDRSESNDDNEDHSQSNDDDDEEDHPLLKWLHDDEEDHPKASDDDEDHPVSNPVLKFKDNNDKQEWVNIELQATQDEETYSIMLAVWDDKFYGVGFMNQSRVWYDLGNKQGDTVLLPEEYNSVLLGWGVNYRRMMQADTWEEAADKIKKAELGKDFAVKAVRLLSRYPDLQEDEDPRQALAGLLIMFCESARFNPICRSFQTDWNQEGEKLEENLMVNYIRNWETMSEVLRNLNQGKTWEDIDDDNTSKLEGIGINTQDQLRDVIHLVFNSGTDARDTANETT